MAHRQGNDADALVAIDSPGGFLPFAGIGGLASAQFPHLPQIWLDQMTPSATAIASALPEVSRIILALRCFAILGSGHRSHRERRRQTSARNHEVRKWLE